MRRLLQFAAIVCGLPAGAWAQATFLQCGVPADTVKLDQTTIGPGGVPTANFNFSAQQGDAVYIRVAASSSDPNFSPRLGVKDPYGNTVSPRPAATTSTPPVPGTTPSALAVQGAEFDLAADGSFTVTVQSNGPSANITVEFTRLNRPCSISTLRCGQSIQGQISQIAQMDAYQFPAAAGDILSVRALKTSSAANPADPSARLLLAIYGPDGHVLTTTLGTPAAGVSQTQPLSVVNVKATGAVTIVIFENSGFLGGLYALSVTKLNGGCGGPALQCGSTVDGQVAAGLNFYSYNVQAQAGDAFLFRLARQAISGTFSASAEIYDAQGTLLGTVSAASATPHVIASTTITFPSTGTYLVLVAGSIDGSSGGYTLSTVRLNRPCDGAQSLGCGSVVDGAISGLLRNNIYSLSASANDAFLLRLLHTDQNPSFRPRVDIYDARGNTVNFLNTSDLGRVSFTAPTDGLYTLLLTDSFDNSQTGTYTLSLLRLNRPCNAGALSCGAQATGSFSRALQTSVYTYTAAPGDSFSVRMMDIAALQNSTLQPGVEVYDPQGSLTGQNISGNAASVDVVKPAGGVYTVVALDNSHSPAPGSFGLDVLRTRNALPSTGNACAMAAPIGQTVGGVIGGAEPFLSYSLPLASGDALSLRSATLTTGFAAQMELYDPDGVRLDSGTFGLTRRAAASGTYTVLVSAATPRTGGAYALAWQLLNHPAGTSALACGGSVTASLAPANQFRYYTAAANTGDILRLLFTRISENFAPQIELYDPTGTRLTATSDITQTAAAGGNYLIVVSPSTSNGETGSYTIAYQRPNNPCSAAALTCGQTTLRQVNVPGQLDAFTFTGAGGDQTTIRLASRSGAYSPFVEMYNAAGTRLSTSSNGLLRSVLTADGTYLLLVRDRSGVNLGSYRVSVQDDFNACPVNDTEAPTITLLKPTGGEVLPGGLTYRIAWQSDDNVAVAAHDIALSTDAGKTFATIIAGGLSGNTQTYDWSVPADVAPTRTAVIKVTATDAAGNAQSAASDLLTLIGSGFTPNSSATLTWDSLNRLTQAALSDGRTVQYTWDAEGNLVQITISGQ